jgi:hypothetical protein
MYVPATNCRAVPTITAERAIFGALAPASRNAVAGPALMGDRTDDATCDCTACSQLQFEEI